jgi:hypothetical protein
MTSNQNSTKTFEKYRNAMIALQSIVSANKSEEPEDNAVWVKQAHFLKEHRLHKHFFKAMQQARLITVDVSPEKRIGSYIRWVKQGNDNIVLTDDVKKLLNCIDEVNKETIKQAKARLITKRTNVVDKQEFDPKKIDHQIQILKSKLEKEKTAKGYLRADEAMIYPHVIAGLETLKVIKELT